MRFLTMRHFHPKALISTKLSLSAVLICIGTLFSLTAQAAQLLPYSAKYDVMRKGKRHGEAFRELQSLGNDKYLLSYQSDIDWLIFSDNRKETSEFIFTGNMVAPLNYSMTRSGTGPDREYLISFDRESKQINSNQSKYPLECEWNDAYQDSLSYQLQIREELKQGKTQFNYALIDKKGHNREYSFEVVGKETITLPVGNVETIKVKRVYDNDKRQALAWFAPSMDYMLVRMWKGEKGVEQFEVQLKSYNPEPPPTAKLN